MCILIKDIGKRLPLELQCSLYQGQQGDVNQSARGNYKPGFEGDTSCISYYGSNAVWTGVNLYQLLPQTIDHHSVPAFEQQALSRLVDLRMVLVRFGAPRPSTSTILLMTYARYECEKLLYSPFILFKQYYKDLLRNGLDFKSRGCRKLKRGSYLRMS